MINFLKIRVLFSCISLRLRSCRKLRAMYRVFFLYLGGARSQYADRENSSDFLRRQLNDKNASILNSMQKPDTDRLGE